MSIVCLDTHVLIWGVKKEAEPEQLDKVKRAEYLIEKLHKESVTVIVPSIVLAEILCRVDPSNSDHLKDKIFRDFRVVPFDSLAATIYAEIWYNLGKDGRREIREKEGIYREALKADLMIIATALSRKAWRIYSEDDGLSRIAKGHIEVEPLPVPPPEQKPLF